MTHRKNYDSDFKEKLVLLSYGKKSTSALEREFGLGRGHLVQWRKKHELYGNKKLTAAYFLNLRIQHQKMHILEKKINLMEQKFKILKSAGVYPTSKKTQLFNFILNHEKIYSITLMCSVVNINRHVYHKWKKNIPTKTQQKKILRIKKITEAFFAAKQRYGAHRITIKLQNEGFQISRTTVKKYMRELGLRAYAKTSLKTK